MAYRQKCTISLELFKIELEFTPFPIAWDLFSSSVFWHWNSNNWVTSFTTIANWSQSVSPFNTLLLITYQLFVCHRGLLSITSNSFQPLLFCSCLRVYQSKVYSTRGYEGDKLKFSPGCHKTLLRHCLFLLFEAVHSLLWATRTSLGLRE